MQSEMVRQAKENISLAEYIDYSHFHLLASRMWDPKYSCCREYSRTKSQWEHSDTSAHYHNVRHHPGQHRLCRPGWIASNPYAESLRWLGVERESYSEDLRWRIALALRYPS